MKNRYRSKKKKREVKSKENYSNKRRVVRAFAIHRRVEDMVTAASQVRFRWPSQFPEIQNAEGLRNHTASFVGFIPSLCYVFDRLSPPKQLLLIKKEKLIEIKQLRKVPNKLLVKISSSKKYRIYNILMLVIFI